jgi:hypothetical protein
MYRWSPRAGVVDVGIVGGGGTIERELDAVVCSTLVLFLMHCAFARGCFGGGRGCIFGLRVRGMRDVYSALLRGR